MPVWAVLACVVGSGVVGLLVIVALRRRRVDSLICDQCARAMLPEWESCPFCGWQVRRRDALVEFISGPLGGEVVRLAEEVTTFGSVAGNTVVLSDPAISRKHLAIRNTKDGFVLADLGSTNGVYVNGQRVARYRLATGDVVRVGTTEMVFRVSGKVV